MKLYGKKALLDNIKNSKIVRLINNDKKIIDLLKLNNVNYEFVKKEYFNYLDKSLNHQGIEIETFENKKFENLEEFIKNQNEEKKSIVVILDSILDPYNLGSIIRTCESFKVDAIIYKKDNQVQINELVIKTSAGAIANISMIRVINLSSTIELLKKNKYWIYASVLEKDAKEYDKIEYDNKTCLILGNEQNGISKGLIKESDFLITIPTYGKTSSLNVAIACGILVSRICRQYSKF